jgi:dipeptidyl aminopeptidase/acylaminoacyl peptidase
VTAIESSREPFLTALFHAKLGDPRTEEGRRKLFEESPISQVGNMRRPLLITNPGRAPFIKQSETEEFVAALQAKNIPVTYAHFGDEARIEMRSENRLIEYAVVEAFLSRCLGGRYESIGNDFRGSSIEIEAGADHVPGLARALGARPKAQALP